MKVIIEAQHAVGHPQPRGVGHYSKNLISALLRRKTFEYELTFFDYQRKVQNASRAEQYFAKFCVPLRECNSLDYRVASRDNAAYGINTYNEWTNTKGDIYHFTNLVTIPPRLDGKMVVTMHDVTWKSHPGMISTHASELLDISLARLERIQPFVITDSQSARQQILQYTTISPERISAIYQSYDEESLYPDKTSVSSYVDGDYLLYLGAFESNKNIVRIIESFNIIAEKWQGLKLVIAGKAAWDSTEAIYESVRNSRFRNDIIMPGYVDIETKRRLISNALCFIFPSICEGFGIPVLEAMACGCPVITADNTSLPEVGGNAAIYVNAYDTEQLAFEMEHVVSSDSLRKDLIKKGFEQVTKFSWSSTAEQVENVYSSL